MAPPEAHTFVDHEDTSIPPVTENTPLLDNLKQHEAEAAEDTTHALSPKVIKEETTTLVQLAWPVSLGYVLQQSLNLAQIFTVGHIGTKELAACALTTMLCNVTGYSIGIGMASALDTLCSQAHTGSRDPHALGKHLQRGIVVMAALCFPIAGLWWFAADFLRLMGQDQDIAELSGVFARYAIIGLFPYLVNECMKRYLQAQGIMKASMFVIIIASPLNALLQYLLVWSPLSIGVIGAPVATAVTYWCLPLLTMLYIRFVAGGSAWGGWEWREALDTPQLWEFLKLGLPSVAMTCSEWWAFEVIALAAGWLGDKELAAQTVVLNTCSLTYVIPLGISIGASTRIGNALGAFCIRTAKAAAAACIILASILAVVNCSALVAVRHSWGWLWSDDAEVVQMVASVLPLAAIFQVSDALGAASNGILRGCGRPDLGAYINLIGYYVIGIPIGMAAAFKYGLDIAGLWMGLTIGLIICSATMLVLIVRMNWTAEAERARERIAKGYGALLPGDIVEDEGEDFQV